MTVRNTSGSGDATTQPDIGDRQEVAAVPASAYEIVTGAQNVAGSVPSGLPEVPNGCGGYVFRVASGTPLKQVTITLDTKQLTEQARVRKVNQAIRQARQR